MNSNLYQIIWNVRLGRWVVTSELAKRGKKRSSARRKALLVPLLSLCSSTAFALPTGSELISGQASVSSPAAGHLQINQTSQNAVINWQGFSIGQHETVNIQQPNAQAVQLDRVVGADPSVIQGQLQSNGQVYLVNPNGVLFSNTAQVDVGGLVATTHQISDADFNSGKLHFTQNGATGSVVNQGQISVPKGGVVALIGEQVENSGTIHTPQGSTVLAAGNTVDLDMKGDGLVEVKVTAAALNAQITNHGAISADGGLVVLTAQSSGQLLKTVVNNDGLIEARGLVERNGQIVLAAGNNGGVEIGGTLDVSGQATTNDSNAAVSNLQGGTITISGGKLQVDSGALLNASGSAGGGTITVGDTLNTQQTSIQDGASLQAQSLDHGKAGSILVFANKEQGTVTVAGRLDASAPNHGDGGSIETSAAQVQVADSAQVSTLAADGKTGLWIIDPIDYTIAASGGNMTGAALSNTLSQTDFSVLTNGGNSNVNAGNGNINVNDVISWSNHKLTLNALHNIYINANINASGSAQLALQYGQASPNTGSGDNYYLNNGASITLPAGQNFSTQLGSGGIVQQYTVITSLGNAGSTTATDLQGMTGNLAGHYALGADIDASATSNWNSGAGFNPVGNPSTPFSGRLDGLGHAINNLGINRPSTNFVGLFGELGTGAVVNHLGLTNVNIKGNQYVAGLTGEILSSASVDSSYVTGTILGTNIVAGFAGNSAGVITNSYSNANITSNSDNAAGLVAELWYGQISNSYNTGNITGPGTHVGGVAADCLGCTISSSYNSGTVHGHYVSGGVSAKMYTGTIIDSYNTGLIIADANSQYIGGLVGLADAGSQISNSYSTGNVSGSDSIGGLLGANAGGSTVTNTYATGRVSGGSNLGGLIGFNSGGGTVTSSFWNTQTTGQSNSAGGNGLTSLQMQGVSSFTNFSFTTTPGATGNGWVMVDTDGRLNNAGDVSGATLPMLASEYSTNITNAHQLQLMAMNLAGNYTLSANIDATASGNSADVWGSGGFIPIGTANSHPFTGTLDGLGHVINNLTINRPSTDYVGLFSQLTSGAHLANLGLSNVTITGRTYVGGLTGQMLSNASVDSSYVSGVVQGHDIVAGLVGSNVNGGPVSHSHSSANVTAITNDAAGIVAQLWGATTTVSNSYNTGTISGLGIFIGGIAGDCAYNCNIINSYNTGTIKGHDTVGGVAAKLYGSTITNSYNSGQIIGDASSQHIGGLVGYTDAGSQISHITNSYSTGDVSGNFAIGGLIGANNNSTTVTNTYATGKVTGSSSLGGLIGLNNQGGAVVSSFWNTDSSGQTSSAGGTGLNSTQMTQLSSFSSWNTTAQPNTISAVLGTGSTWFIADGQTPPQLTAFPIVILPSVPSVVAVPPTQPTPALPPLTNTPPVAPVSSPTNNSPDPIVQTTNTNNISPLLISLANPTIFSFPGIGGNPGLSSNAIIDTTPGFSGNPPSSPYAPLPGAQPGLSSTAGAGGFQPSSSFGVIGPSNPNGFNFMPVSFSPDEYHAELVVPTFAVKNNAPQVASIEMSPDRNSLTMLLADGELRVWDFDAGLQRLLNPGSSEEDETTDDASRNKAASAQFNQAGNELSGNGGGNLIELQGGTATANDSASSFNNSASNPIANPTLTGSGSGIGTRGLSMQDFMREINGDKPAIDTTQLKHFSRSVNGELMLGSATDNQLSLWDSLQSKKQWHLSYQRGEVDSLAMTKNNRYGAVLSQQPGSMALNPGLQVQHLTDAVDIVDLASGKVIHSIPNLGEHVIYMEFTNEDTLQLGLANGDIVTWAVSAQQMATKAHLADAIKAVDAYQDSYAYILPDGTVQISNGKDQPKLSIQNQDNPFKYAKLIQGNEKLLTMMENGEMSLWDVNSATKLLRMFSSKKGWTVMDAFGRFDGSEEALENFSWEAEKYHIPLDSFSENFYEPGLLSNVLRNHDYINQHATMVKNGITLPPKVELQLAQQQASGSNVALQLDVFDRGGGIAKINIYHNGKLLSNDSVVTAQQVQQVNNSIEHRLMALNINPTPGKNSLKVTASNLMGIETNSSEVSFDGATKTYTSAVRLLTVGIDKYSDPKLNLSYSVADAQLIGTGAAKTASVVSNKNLYNEKATKANIIAELKELSQGEQQDNLIIYFAGHGVAIGKEWYFLPYETKIQPTVEAMAAHGVSATELSDIFKSSKMQHILVMIDSCYSGASTDAFEKLQTGQHYFTRQLSRSLGITMITAASKDKEAYELQSLGHGLFTYLMAEDLQIPGVNHTAHSIAENIVKTLPAFSKKMVGDVQEPAVYIKGNDFMLTDVTKVGATSATPVAGTIVK